MGAPFYLLVAFGGVVWGLGVVWSVGEERRRKQEKTSTNQREPQINK